MFIQSNSYQLKDLEDEVFVKIYKNEFPISFVRVLGPKIIYASRNELFSKSNRGTKKISSFDSDVSALSIQDEFICVGTCSGSIKIFTEYRKAIRRYHEHEAMVNDIVIYKNPDTGAKTVISCSDDGTIRFYDLLSGNSLKSINLGLNYVKALSVYENMLFAGSNSLFGYSLSSFENIFTYEHNSMITNISIINDLQVAFSSTNKLFIINIIDQSLISNVVHTRDVQRMINYHGMLYTIAADRHLKTFTYQLKHISNFNFKEKPTDFDIVDDRPYISFESGNILGLEEVKEVKQKKSIPYKTLAYEKDIEYVVVDSNKKRLTNIEKLLSGYQYKTCLKLIMEKNDPSTSFTVLKYIHEHRSLKKALADENEKFVQDFLDFCIDNFCIKEFNESLIECLIILTALYSDLIIQNEHIREQLLLLSDVIDEEVAFQETNLQAISFLSSFDK